MNAFAKRHEDRDSRLWTADQFLEFYMTRPEGERWQLVDGLAMMMVPPNLRHQRIGKNLLRVLDRALSKNRPDLEAFWDVGVRIPGRDDFNAQPDLLVVKADASFDRYADVFYLAAEILSPSNAAEMIERKMELYQTHPENLYALKIEQQAVHVTLYSREARWRRQELRSLEEELILPEFGVRAKLAQIYEGTPLAG